MTHNNSQGASPNSQGSYTQGSYTTDTGAPMAALTEEQEADVLRALALGMGGAYTDADAERALQWAHAAQVNWLLLRLAYGQQVGLVVRADGELLFDFGKFSSGQDHDGQDNSQEVAP